MQVLALTRHARAFAVAQSAHEWVEQDVVDVEGRTMGIVGLGSIGAEVARLAQQFGMRVIGMRRTPQGDEPCETWTLERLHELLPRVDTHVLALPLAPETHHLIGAAELALLRPGAHVINVGRGSLIDEPALVGALRSGQVGAAALDVTEVEPLPADSPLWDLQNVIIEGARRLKEIDEITIHVDNLDVCLKFPENPKEKYAGVWPLHCSIC